MAKKNFTFTISLNDEPSADWAEHNGVSVEELSAKFGKIAKVGRAYLIAEHEKGNDQVDGALMLIHLIEEKALTEDLISMLVHQAIQPLIQPKSSLLETLKEGLEEDNS